MNQFPINAMPLRAWPTGSYVGSTGGLASEGVIIWRDRGYVAGSEARVFASGNLGVTAPALTASTRLPDRATVGDRVLLESAALLPEKTNRGTAPVRSASPRLASNNSNPSL
jgi:hypothetical protein